MTSALVGMTTELDDHMSMEILLVAPYLAITASLLLIVTVAMTCHLQPHHSDTRTI